MSTPVRYHQPAPQEPAPAREAQPARPGELVAARAQALFTSDLSAQCEHTEAEVAAAIRHAIATHNGLRGCAGEVAAAYGDHPETSARRMRWARVLVENMYGGPPAAGVSVTAAVPAAAGTVRVNAGQADAGHGAAGRGTGRRPSLAEQGYVHGRFGGVPVLVGPELTAQLKAMRQKQP
jgi:hypothetical protein